MYSRRAATMASWCLWLLTWFCLNWSTDVTPVLPLMADELWNWSELCHRVVCLPLCFCSFRQKIPWCSTSCFFCSFLDFVIKSKFVAWQGFWAGWMVGLPSPPKHWTLLGVWLAGKLRKSIFLRRDLNCLLYFIVLDDNWQWHVCSLAFILSLSFFVAHTLTWIDICRIFFLLFMPLLEKDFRDI